MLYYKKAIKQNGNYQFKPLDIVQSTELKEVIRDFFTDSMADIHAVVVCTERPDAVMSEEEFENQLRDVHKNVAILPQDGNIPEGHILYARPEPSDYLGEALKKALDRITEAIGTGYIREGVIPAIQARSVGENPGKGMEPEAHEGLWTVTFAKNTSKPLHTDKLDEDNRGVPNIRILLILPERFFDIFSREDCYFPSFLEYVVHAVDEVRFYKDENNDLKRQLQEAIDEAKLYKDKAQFYINENNDLQKQLQEEKQLNKEITEKKEQILDLVAERLGEMYYFIQDGKNYSHDPGIDRPATKRGTEAKGKQGFNHEQRAMDERGQEKVKAVQDPTMTKRKINRSEDHKSEDIDNKDMMPNTDWDRGGLNGDGGKRR